MGSQYALVLRTSDQVIDAYTFNVFLDGLQKTIHEHARVVSLALPPPTLPASALHCFVQTLFSNNGVALSTLKKLYAHLRSIPVGASPEPAARYGKVVQVVPDEATKDVLYLTTVADIVSQLLVAADGWSAMEPVAIPSELGRRCVFSAFDDVIQDYVQLERRIIERAYETELSQWMAKAKSDPFNAGSAKHDNAHSNGGSTSDGILAERSRRDSVASARGGTVESIRLVNFHQREQQMQQYKLRVLTVLEGKLNISLPAEALGVNHNNIDTIT
ncbi:hypothetical protein FBU59_006887, partial [Linderina macrospora]